MTTRTNFTRRKIRRHEEAKLRQEAWATLSFEQQLQALDNRFGDAHGATKQRVRIAKQIVERDKPQPKPQPKGKRQRRGRREDKK